MSFFPIFSWLKTYSRTDFNGDLFAGVMTAILLVPQGIAFALLAGLPPQFGLYASILPPLFYAVLGTSRTLSVGPVSIAAIMIASVLQLPEVSALGNPLQSAVILSAESGAILLIMAIFRMGGLVNFISHPVLTGFTSGAALLIIGSQLPQTLGLKSPTCGFDTVCYQTYLQGTNTTTLLMTGVSLALLLFFGKPLLSLLKILRLSPSLITAIGKCGALVTVAFTTFAVVHWNLTAQHVAVVGEISAGLPHLSFDFIDLEKWKILASPASFIALIAYVESVAIAKVVANLRNEKINPNQELIALGFSNFAAAVSGGMPVAGGFSRTMVNFSAGARTQIAMVIAAIILSIAVVFFTVWFSNIPKTALAVIILVAVIPLVKFKSILHTWQYDKGDGIAELTTLISVLILGIEKGITLGIILTFASYLRKASHPHIAVVGRLPNTKHYRNIKRHKVETWEHLLLMRIDENITFANINFVEEFIETQLRNAPNVKHIVLIFTSVSDIDMTAIEALEQLNESLKNIGITLNFAEVKGFLLDKLEKSDLFTHLNGERFFDVEEAVTQLNP
ncbi:MAG: SulP family inorganic anion transporter [Methylococcales bacterium]|nr:SulP family inorganic anion transporter [Methylococcales bacterium]